MATTIKAKVTNPLTGNQIAFDSVTEHEIDANALGGTLSGGSGTEITVNEAGTFAWTGNHSFPANNISLTGASTDADAPLSRAEIETLIAAAQAGLSPKQSVRAIHPTNKVLTGAAVIDGLVIATGERVLLANQTDPIENGIYEYDGTQFVRPDDLPAGSDASGASVFVTEGTSADQQWYVTSDGTVTGTDAMTWSQFSTGSGVTAGDGITDTSGTLSVDPHDGTGNVVPATVDGTGVGLSYDATEFDHTGSVLSLKNPPTLPRGFQDFSTDGTTTVFNITDGDLNVAEGMHDVYLNGQRLKLTDDYTAAAGAITLNVAWPANGAGNLAVSYERTTLAS